MYKKLIDWYFTKAAVPFWYVLISDCFIVLCSGVLAYAFNHIETVTLANLSVLLYTLALYLPAYLIGFRLFHTYSGIIRDSTAADLIRIAFSLSVAIALIMLVRVFLHIDSVLLAIRFRDLFLQSLLSLVAMCGVRVSAKVFYNIYLRNKRDDGVYGLQHDTLLEMEMKDFLSREPIRVDMQAIKARMSNRRIMVTGAAGSIGGELANLLAGFEPQELILIDQAETPLHAVRLRMNRKYPNVKCTTVVCNICHSHRMETIFTAHQPEIVFHAAAYKHVPMMEDNPTEAVLNNIDGTRKLADLAIKYKVKSFIMVSTDKAVNPTNVMGCSKRICEMYCQSLSGSRDYNVSDTHFITTRFGNVLDSNGSVIPIFREQIRRGGPITVTHPDVIRFFMLISEACRLVLEAATIGKSGEIYVFDMGKPVRIIDLAKGMIELSGKSDVKIEITGLRPGEKLYEEVLDDKETVLPTTNPKIKVAKVRKYSYEEVKEQVNCLIEIAKEYNAIRTVQYMKTMVPEYKSQNSIYTKLDKTEYK